MNLHYQRGPKLPLRIRVLVFVLCFAVLGFGFVIKTFVQHVYIKHERIFLTNYMTLYESHQNIKELDVSITIQHYH